MLVLSRKKEEKILVNVPGMEEEIEVTIVQIDSNRVRIGFNAPPNVTILRSELKKEAKSVPNKE